MGYGIPSEGSSGAAGLGLKSIREAKAKRVVSVVYDASHEFYEGLQSIGKIFFEDVTSPLNDRIGEVKLNINNSAFPITSNSQFFPLIGEIVLTVKTVSNKPISRKGEYHKFKNYYYPPLRIHNQSSHNSFPSKFLSDRVSSKQLREKVQDGSPNKAAESTSPKFPLGEYFEDKDIKRLIPFEGDYIIEGRFGNSIRFGATTPFDINKPMEEQAFPNPWSIASVDGEDTSDKTKAQVGDPITIIRNGQKVDIDEENSTLEDYLEDINGDHSSIYMCSNQRLVDFRVAGQINPVGQDSYLSTSSIDYSKYDRGDDMEFLFRNAVVGGAGTNLLEGINDPFGGISVQTSGLSTSVNNIIIPPPIEFTPPIPTDTTYITNQDETEDGLSFYEEMVERSGVVAADHFETEEFTYTCATTEELIIEGQGATEALRTSQDIIRDRLSNGNGSGGVSVQGTTGKAITGGAADFWSLLSMCLFEERDPQGRADVAQSMYNRSAKPGGYYEDSLAKNIKHNGAYQPAFNKDNGGPKNMKTHPKWLAIDSLETAIAACNQHYVHRKKVNFDNAKIEGKLKEVWNAIKDPTRQKKAADLVQGRTDFFAKSEGSAASRNADRKGKKFEEAIKYGGYVARNSVDNVFGWTYYYVGNSVAQAPTGDFWTKYIPSSWK